MITWESTSASASGYNARQYQGATCIFLTASLQFASRQRRTGSSIKVVPRGSRTSVSLSFIFSRCRPHDSEERASHGHWQAPDTDHQGDAKFPRVNHYTDPHFRAEHVTALANRRSTAPHPRRTGWANGSAPQCPCIPAPPLLLSSAPRAKITLLALCLGEIATLTPSPRPQQNKHGDTNQRYISPPPTSLSLYGCSSFN